jgi:CDP-diacylglycerol--glycerol-3-phosphate 3-phosphatidyltransferase
MLYLSGQGWLAVGIGTVAGLTDHLDGYLARRLKQETALGAMLDQAADSFTTAILLAMLAVMDGIPFAYLAIFLMREFWVGTVRRYGASVGIEIPSNALGKLATAIIYWAILGVAVAILPDMPARVGTALQWMGVVGLGVGLAMSCLTGWRYTTALVDKTA